MRRFGSKAEIQTGVNKDSLVSPFWTSVCPSVKWGYEGPQPPQADAIVSTEDKELCPPQGPAPAPSP